MRPRDRTEPMAGGIRDGRTSWAIDIVNRPKAVVPRAISPGTRVPTSFFLARKQILDDLPRHPPFGPRGVLFLFLAAA